MSHKKEKTRQQRKRKREKMKLTYRKPEIVEFGRVSDIVNGAAGNADDGGGGSFVL